MFSFWYNRLRERAPGERPTAEALHQASGLPLSTCLWYRRQYESIFPDAYAVSQVRRNLRLSRRQLKRARQPPEGRSEEAGMENAFTNLANLPAPPPCLPAPTVQ